MLRRYQQVHWSAFNIVGRLIGIMAGIVAVCFVAWGVYFLLRPEESRSIDTGGIAEGALDLLFGAFSGAVSVLLLIVRPYRPDLGDRAWTWRAGKFLPSSERRSWWTGTPK